MANSINWKALIKRKTNARTVTGFTEICKKKAYLIILIIKGIDIINIRKDRL